MAIFFVAFDLNHEDGYDHYEELTKELTKLRGHRIMNYACLLNVNTDNPQTLLTHLKKFLEDTDRTFAARIDTENSYFLHAYPGTNEWIEHNPLNKPNPIKLDS